MKSLMLFFSFYSKSVNPFLSLRDTAIDYIMTEIYSSTFHKVRTFKFASRGKMVLFLCGIIESLLTRQSRTMMFTTRTKVFVTDLESLCKVRNLLVFIDWSLSLKRDMIDAEMPML